MSQHSSLRSSSNLAKHRNVLKRFERIKKLKTDEVWSDDSKVFGMPKVKSQKIKVRKSAKTGKPDEKEGQAAKK